MYSYKNPRAGVPPGWRRLRVLWSVLVLLLPACASSPPPATDGIDDPEGPTAESIPRPVRIAPPRTMSRNGLDLARLGRYRRAIAIWTAMLEAHDAELTREQKARTAHNIASAFVRSDRKPEAIYWLNKALAWNPSDAGASDLLLELHLQREPPDPQREIAQHVHRVVARLEATWKRRRDPKAPRPPAAHGEMLRKAIAAGVCPGEAHYGLGLLLAEEKGKGGEAESHLAKAIEIDDAHESAALHLARLQGRRGDRKAARETLQASFARGNGDERTSFALACLLANEKGEGDRKLFLHCTKRTLALDPERGPRIVAAVKDPSLRAQVEALADRAQAFARQRASLEEVRKIIYVPTYDISGHKGVQAVGWSGYRHRASASSSRGRSYTRSGGGSSRGAGSYSRRSVPRYSANRKSYSRTVTTPAPKRTSAPTCIIRGG